MTVVTVTTPDAGPDAAPYRISDKSGWTTATLGITPDVDIDGYLVRVGGVDADSGVLAGMGGLWPVAGLQPQVGLMPPTQGFLLAAGATATEDIDATELGPASPPDGDYQITVYVHRNGAWS